MYQADKNTKNQVYFLEDLNPIWYFGWVVTPNNESTPIGVVGLGVHWALPTFA